ncbi:hypothetical protein BGZ63DRAFT_487205 [Mariannaea sp. PMI_226]|nr:hypothetical protein BGZ63DRAFT_487205 [Mariannaea sp. PMI_226]
MDFSQRWVTHLRSSNKQDTSSASSTTRCPICSEMVSLNMDSFRSHVEGSRAEHSAWENDEAVESAFKSLQAKSSRGEPARLRKRPVHELENRATATSRTKPDSKATEQRSSRRRSPSASADHQHEAVSPPSSIRTRAHNTSARQPWTDEDAVRPKEPSSYQEPRGRSVLPTPPKSRSTPPASRHQPLPKHEASTPLMPQPETRPISQDQLIAEVKGIYAGLVMVETKCIEVDNAYSSSTSPDAANKLNNEQWQALIALHRTLLHEHHDFFLASQHPSASPALRRLASKYAMPARMWRHGIHSFLELLRHRLPDSLEHMLSFLYLAYSMMALLYETVPAFEDTWIECLGDLGRYRMAIEDDDIRDREIWTSVSRHWYRKAVDKSPTTGRLYRHLAILARPNALQQLFYYTKSLCVAIPFSSARESIMTLFDPLLRTDPISQQHPPGSSFPRDSVSSMSAKMAKFLNVLDKPSSSSLILLSMLLYCTKQVYASEDSTASDIGRDDTDIPGWVFPIVFALITAGFDIAGRFYEERRKFYVLEMVASNISFPLLASDDQVSRWLTGRFV